MAATSASKICGELERAGLEALYLTLRMGRSLRLVWHSKKQSRYARSWMPLFNATSKPRTHLA